MKLLVQLRGIRYQIKKLQENQKELPPLPMSSGCPSTPRDPIQEIDKVILEVEALYGQLLDVQTDHIKYLKNDFNEDCY